MRGNPTLSFRMIVSLGNVLKGHSFTVYGKTRFRAALYQGTTSVVPISRLFLTRRADVSPRGVCLSDFFRSLFSRAHRALLFAIPSGLQSARADLNYESPRPR